MKTLLFVTLLSFGHFASAALSINPPAIAVAEQAERRLVGPTCVNGKLSYSKLSYQDNLNSLFADFCLNEKGISTPEECVKYQLTIGEEATFKEVSEFAKKKLAKICGK